jgi:hypothetical protein
MDFFGRNCIFAVVLHHPLEERKAGKQKAVAICFPAFLSSISIIQS